MNEGDLKCDSDKLVDDVIDEVNDEVIDDELCEVLNDISQSVIDKDMGNEYVKYDSDNRCVHNENGEPCIKKIKQKDFVYLNCRGTETIISKDSAELIPYIDLLINGTFKNNPCDKKGNLIIDESSGSLFYMIDMYRAWLEGNKPKSLGLSMTRVSPGTQQYLYASIARRLGFEKEFIDAIVTPKSSVRKKDYFSCYYCKNIYAKNEKRCMDECSYHGLGCECRYSYRGCRRIPYHSEIKITGAVEPK